MRRPGAGSPARRQAPGPALPAVLLAAVAVLAAGCLGDGGDGDGGGAPDAGAPGTLPMLHGFVFDAALRPLDGTTVKVLDTNASLVTGADGFFGFDGLPVEQFIVVVAAKEGYQPSSKQVTLTAEQPTRLNFTLEPVPVQTPYSQVADQDLFIECQAGFVLNEENYTQGCGSGAQDVDHWDIAVEPGLAGAVVELYWEPVTEAARSAALRLETLELGQLNLILGEVVGESPLRVMVPQAVAERYYASGGLMRLTVFAAPNADETEAGSGASLLFQQPMTAYASLFYVAPPDPSYTIADAA
jgi:hypothetical protein